MKAVKSWGELVGPVIRESDVPEDIQQQPGLLRCTTRQGTVVLPVGQFTHSGDSRVPSPEMQKAVLLLDAENITGSGHHDWTNAGFLLGTSQDELQGATFAEILTDTEASELEKYRALGVLMTNIDHGFISNSIDPDKVWGFIFRGEQPRE